jgi:hypothetical protein
MAWIAYRGASTDGPGSRTITTGAVVRAAVRPAGGAWSAAFDLSEPGADAGSVQVGVDARGRAVVGWRREAPGGFRVEAVEGDVAGLADRTPATLSRPGKVRALRLAVGADGRALLMWTEASGLRARARSAPGALWGSVEPIADRPTGPTVLALALTPGGEALAAWRAGRGHGAQRIHAARRGPFGGWSAPTMLSGAGVIDGPSLAAGRDGGAEAVWTRSLGPRTTRWVAEHARRPAGGAWRALKPLTASTGPVAYPAVTVTPAGPLLAWARIDSSGRSTVALRSP